MPGYTKLFSSIVGSTIWREPAETKVVWITLLAISNASGRVDVSIPGLADLARVPVESCRIALKTLLSPDPDSRTKDNEGRRIREIEGGFEIINYVKYRENRDAEIRREQNRIAQARYRERKRVIHSKPEVSHGKPQSAQAEAYAEAEAGGNTFRGPSAPRQRNPLLDALAGIDGADPRQVTPKAWGGIAKCLSEIQAVCPDLTPEELKRRAGNYRRRMPMAQLTPFALSKHWADCDNGNQAQTLAQKHNLR